MSKPLVDWLGREVERGDLIVYPVREGSVMNVTLARVLYQRKTGELEVYRLLTNGRPVGRRPRGLVQRLDRVTLVDESTIPEEIKNKMKAENT